MCLYKNNIYQIDEIESWYLISILESAVIRSQTIDSSSQAATLLLGRLRHSPEVPNGVWQPINRSSLSFGIEASGFSRQCDPVPASSGLNSIFEVDHAVARLGFVFKIQKPCPFHQCQHSGIFNCLQCLGQSISPVRGWDRKTGVFVQIDLFNLI